MALNFSVSPEAGRLYVQASLDIIEPI